ncbi:MAG TPA: hypothetical protein VKV39_07910 [Candidatus Sulfotelmatobacter sp.]|nr:hypothetical protein [Candidatus Sulfotelmatobacter sp.]
MHESLHRRLTVRFPVSATVFVLCCLLSSARLAWNAGKASDSNQVALRSDPRFAALKAALPAHGVVGYVGDPGQSPGEYYLAQYALAPLVVDHSVNHSLVVGNVSKTAFAPTSNLALVHDFGNGVLLLANEGAR